MVRWYETCTFCRTTGKSPNPYPLLPMEMSMTRHFRWCELYKHGDCIMWCSTVDLLNCPIPLLRIPPYPALQVWLPARMTICLHLPESESHPVMSNSLRPRGLYSPWNSPGQHTGVGSLSLFQGIFPTQGSNPGVLHCRPIFFFFFYRLSHKGSPRILECVSYPFSRESSQPRNWTRVSCIAGGFFTNWAMREALDFSQF